MLKSLYRPHRWQLQIQPPSVRISNLRKVFYGLNNSLNRIQDLSFALCYVYAKLRVQRRSRRRYTVSVFRLESCHWLTIFRPLCFFSSKRRGCCLFCCLLPSLFALGPSALKVLNFSLTTTTAHRRPVTLVLTPGRWLSNLYILH